MSLDGAFLSIVKNEIIAENFIGGRVDKIHQPSREEIVITMRTGGGNRKLLFSANIMSARLCITENSYDNPKTPPMFCMLLRKHIGNGRLSMVSQDGLERIINFDFDCMNEIGDMVTNRLTIEIMGRASNIILMTMKDGVYRVIDSIKRVTDDISSVRRILPNIIYELPPRDNRLIFTHCSNDEIIERLKMHKNERLSKSMLSIFEGISPIFARECADFTAHDVDIVTSEILDDKNKTERFFFFLSKAKNALENKPTPVIVSEKNGKYKDFSFINIEQYGTHMLIIETPSCNALLDKYFRDKSTNERVRQRSGDLLKKLMNLYERTQKKLEIQKNELRETENRDLFRVRGDLINANIYRLEKGMASFEADNYETGEKEVISLDLRLTPSQNAQKYYSEYKKRLNAEKMLTKFISEGEKELIYIDSVFDAASRISTDSELSEIKDELIMSGYLRAEKVGKKGEKKPKSLPPLEFTSSDGFKILVGRNNLQNDKLTLKTAKDDDIWLHTKDISGSHVIICCEGKKPPDNTIEEAATIAAYHSKAKNSTKVPVDYVDVRYVKKPSGAKPGMVIFTNNKTILVNPNENELLKGILKC